MGSSDWPDKCVGVVSRGLTNQIIVHPISSVKRGAMGSEWSLPWLDNGETKRVNLFFPGEGLRGKFYPDARGRLCFKERKS